MIQVQNNIAYSDINKELQIKGTAMRGYKFKISDKLSIDNLEEVNPIEYIDHDYGSRVNELIRLRYSLSEELSLLRQRDIKKEEFDEYNNYCEECKLKAKNNDK